MDRSNRVVNWEELLKDRINKRTSGLVDQGLYNAVMANRSHGDQTGSRIGQIVVNPAASKGAITSAVSNTGSSGQHAIQQSKAQQERAQQQQNKVISSASPAASTTTTSSSSETASVPGAGSGPSWQWGDPVEGLPFDYSGGNNQWFLDAVAQANRDNAASDPAMMRRLWVAGRGGDLTTEQLFGNYVDPQAMMDLYGINAVVDEQASFLDSFGNFATSGGGPSMNPRDIVSRMVTAGMQRDSSDAETGVQANRLAETLGANASADIQVQNFTNMLDQSVRFLMDERTYAAYRSLIDREAQKYLDWRMSPQGTVSTVSFAQWLNDRLGPTAGL